MDDKFTTGLVALRAKAMWTATVREATKNNCILLWANSLKIKWLSTRAGSRSHGDHGPPLPQQYCQFAMSTYSESALRGCSKQQVVLECSAPCFLDPAPAWTVRLSGQDQSPVQPCLPEVPEVPEYRRCPTA